MTIPRPTTRLLALLELMQARDLVSGAELARRLEVDGRSVRRYIAMLDEIGISVETVRGPHGGYRLRPGPVLPPLLLTDEEAIALALALQALPNVGLDLGAGVAAGLRAKLERTLPAGVQARLRALEANVAFPPEAPVAPAEGPLIAALGEAAEAGRQVQLRYRADDGTITDRLIDPYGVARWSRAWYLVAYCHLRVGVRLFRLDRIASAEPMASRFAPPPAFDAYAHVARAMADYPGRWSATILLDLPLEEARGLIPATYGTLETDEAGRVRFQGRFDDLDGTARWLATFGCAITVIAPPELRAALRRLVTLLTAGEIRVDDPQEPRGDRAGQSSAMTCLRPAAVPGSRCFGPFGARLLRVSATLVQQLPLEDEAGREVQVGQDARGQRLIASNAGECAVGCAFQGQDFDDRRLGADDPVFRHAGPRVEAALDDPIVLRIARAEDFHD